MALNSKSDPRNSKNEEIDYLLDSCRVCMARNKDMNSVFDTIKGDIICDKIKFCTGLQVINNDGLPSRICNNCLEDVIVAFKFKTSCLLADETFRNLIKNNIKSEIVDMTYDDFNYDDDGYQDDYFGDGAKVKDELLLNVLAGNRARVQSEGDIKEEHSESHTLVKTIDPTESPEKTERAGPRKTSNVPRSIRDWETGKVTYKPKSPISATLPAGSSKPKPQTTALGVSENPSPNKVKRKKRGPYKKTGKPKRVKKYTFPRLTCIPCKIKFKSKQEFEDHKKDIHNEKEESWVCEICGKVFVHRASHYTHIKSHLPPTFGCADCDYITWHKHDLVKHIRIHTGVKLYQCEFCSKSYYTSSNLLGHIRRFHEGMKPFACTMCDKKFHDRSKLNRHIDSHNDIKRFECDICHSGYTRRCYWKKHLLTQHNVVIPPQRPGRQKTNLIIGECLINALTDTGIGQ